MIFTPSKFYNSTLIPKTTLILFLALGLLLPLAVPALGTAGQGNLYLIFDASGSMWGQLKGKNKITIAKEVLVDLVKNLPDDKNVGLVVYGHRKKGDCQDVEEVFPLGKLDKKKLIARINEINPKGKTPISLSVETTANKLKGVKGQSTIILISDGIETCGGDPCALVAALRAAGVDFVMHVIGFDVKGDAAKQLSCMAQKGGGEFYSANDAKEFKKAAVEAVEKAAGYNLAVTVKRNGKLIPAMIYIVKKDTGAKTAERQSLEDGPTTFNLEPGEYDIRVVDEWADQKPSKTVTGVVVEKDKVKNIEVGFGGGTLKVSAVKKGKLASADVFVYEAGTGKQVSNIQANAEKPLSIKLEAGTYNVKVKDEWGSGAVLEFKNIELSSGETRTIKAVFSNGRLLVNVKKDGKPYVADVFIYKPGVEKYLENMASRLDQDTIFELPAGSYTVEIKDEWGDGKVKVIKDVVVEGDQDKKLDITF